MVRMAASHRSAEASPTRLWERFSTPGTPHISACSVGPGGNVSPRILATRSNGYRLLPSWIASCVSGQYWQVNAYLASFKELW